VPARLRFCRTLAHRRFNFSLPRLTGKDMGEKIQESPFGKALYHWQAVVLICFTLILPLLLPGFGWLYVFIPLPSFYYLVCRGEKEGGKIVGQGLFFSGIVAGLLKVLALFLFAGTFLTISFSLARSIKFRYGPAEAGGRAAAALLAGWLILTAAYGLVYKANLYSDLRLSIDRGIEAAYPIYLKNAELPPELKEEVKQAFEAIRQTIPKILPSLLAIWLLFSVWLTMSIGAAILNKYHPGLLPWPSFCEWRLHEATVWGLIVSGLLLIVPASRITGLNGLIIALVLYFFQGLAVLATLFNRWRVPSAVRFIIYLLTFMQLYGPLFLSLLGLIDVWANFKKLGGSSAM
jgi:hypothetical protein